MTDYRGACVEDLQLSPALVLSSDVSAGEAVQMAFEREYTILPLSSPSTRQLLGWLHAPSLRSALESGAVDPNTPLGELHASAKGASGGGGAGVTRFERARGYEVITPDTPLEQLEAFFERGKASGVGFALVTDAARKFVLGVVTPEDLDKFASRRNLKPSPAPAA